MKIYTGQDFLISVNDIQLDISDRYRMRPLLTTFSTCLLFIAWTIRRTLCRKRLCRAVSRVHSRSTAVSVNKHQHSFGMSTHFRQSYQSLLLNRPVLRCAIRIHRVPSPVSRSMLFNPYRHSVLSSVDAIREFSGSIGQQSSDVPRPLPVASGEFSS